eukprot:10528524-Ditylum_brightwellii.AAC.1
MIDSKDSPSAIPYPQDHEDRHIKQEPKDIQPSTTIDKGYYEHSEVIIEDRLNKKDLFKIESNSRIKCNFHLAGTET